MTKRGILLQLIEQRVAGRANEIEQIPIPWMRGWYKKKLQSDETMREYFIELGDLLHKFWNNALMLPLFRFLNSRFGPLIFKRQFRLSTPPKKFLESVVDYYMFFTSYGAWPLEIVEVTEDRVVACSDKCTVNCEEDLGLCLAATSMEPELSKKPYFNAKITYTERIPEGAKIVYGSFRAKRYLRAGPGTASTKKNA